MVISDGKAGHLNQSLGLAEALLRLHPSLQLKELPALPRGEALRELLWPGGPRLRARLLIGAGHGTHLSLIALRRREACPAVVLMKPSLPRACFDLCIEPRHDGGEATMRRWLTDGPMNRVQPGASRDRSGLILIGGPSSHFSWDQDALLDQITALCDGETGWCLSTSRRTPRAFLDALRARNITGLELVDCDTLDGSWLQEQLPRAERCWVSPDSVSMVYEALTAGCAVGVFDLEAKSGSRVASSVADLDRRGLVTSFSRCLDGARPEPPERPFAEADRIAAALVEHGWL
ncbi:MAG: ELM1/GtrOC1 family putative glycosyltransferase [Halieaceae bacterium]|nr:ELM1/GtrOC1 family putative glycosyltransferase [Halieaceae bacterium]